MYGNRDTISVPVFFFIFLFLAISESNKSRDLSKLCMLFLGHYKQTFQSWFSQLILYSDHSRNTSSICRNIYRKRSLCLSVCSCNREWTKYLLWIIEIRLWSYCMFIEATNTESNWEARAAQNNKSCINRRILVSYNAASAAKFQLMWVIQKLAFFRK